jgi:hypothetical protein
MKLNRLIALKTLSIFLFHKCSSSTCCLFCKGWWSLFCGDPSKKDWCWRTRRRTIGSQTFFHLTDYLIRPDLQWTLIIVFFRYIYVNITCSWSGSVVLVFRQTDRHQGSSISQFVKNVFDKICVCRTPWVWRPLWRTHSTIFFPPALSPKQRKDSTLHVILLFNCKVIPVPSRFVCLLFKCTCLFPNLFLREKANNDDDGLVSLASFSSTVQLLQEEDNNNRITRTDDEQVKNLNGLKSREQQESDKLFYDLLERGEFKHTFFHIIVLRNKHWLQRKTPS